MEDLSEMATLNGLSLPEKEMMSVMKPLVVAG